MTERSTTSGQYEAVLRELARAGVYQLPPDRAADIRAAAAACQFPVLGVDLSDVADKAGLMASLARGLRLPGWFGGNWDALAECLMDMTAPPAKGWLVLLEHTSKLLAQDEDDLIVAAQIFDDAAAEWREQGIALWCFVDAGRAGIAWLGQL